MRNKAADQASMETCLIWAGLLLFSAAFVLLPTLDLATSLFFFTPGLGFTHMLDPIVMAVYDWTPLIGRGILLALTVLALTSPWLVRWLRRQSWQGLAERCEKHWQRTAAVAVISGVLGPGLVVEVWLKNTVGRPRPVQVENFGGDHPFKPLFQAGDHPESHRGFVSGHAAAGYWLLSLGLMSGPVWRRRWLLIGILTGSAIGLVRIMQGGHFLSDIVFAFYAVWIPSQIVATSARHWHRTATVASHHPQ